MPQPPPQRDTKLPSSATSAGLISITTDHQKPTNILEAASIKPPTNTTSPTAKKDSSMLDEISSATGLVDGLSSCTESLGFESSEQMEDSILETSTRSKTLVKPVEDRVRCRDLVSKFPPPLSSMRVNNGHYSTSFLKPVREHGRLVLTQVTIKRPEIFNASRGNGRLRLQLINQESESESKGERVIRELKKESDEAQEKGGQWKVPLATGGQSLSARCNELKNHHHHGHVSHNHQQLWNHQFVTTR
ncbi:hypothetical protein IFM89_032352 [Coptis chinensis]|uniref:FAF domain-containing protein n=1 Tax=Coptis chinensis TaxID=261450 RepID=A0A835HUC2_9MAGN|nr:hypothetical protein IFM89_032352 [Coptis chinensis]